jgi:hypothetical protein
MQAGKPTTGHVFPPLRGKHVGKDDKTGVTHEKTGVSHAKAMRRDLQAAFVAHRAANSKVPAEVLDTFCPAKDSARWVELFKGTEFTRPVDFHSWRRRFVQALADIGMNAQQAQKLAGHADLAAHERYLRNTTGTLTIPNEALPDLTAKVVLPHELPKLEGPDTQSSIFSVRHGRFERPTFGSGDRVAEAIQHDSCCLLNCEPSDTQHENPANREVWGKTHGRNLPAEVEQKAADIALGAYLRELATGYAMALRERAVS